jgi:hypothetical protein
MHCVDVLLGARRGVACRRCRRQGGDKGNVSVTCCSPMRRAAHVNAPASRATRRELSHGAHGAVRIRLQRPRRTLASSSSSRRFRSGAGGGLLLYSFDTLCRWLAWRMTRSRLCSRSLLVFCLVLLVVCVPASWRDAVRDVSCRRHLQQTTYMSATFATLGRVAFDGTPAIVSASDFHRGMR